MNALPAGARASDSDLAFKVLYAEDAFAQALQDGSGAALVNLPPDPRLAPDWTVRGTLVSQDVIPSWLPIRDPTECFFGWLLERTAAPGQFMAVVRGTGDAREWFLDAEIGQLAPYLIAGHVEMGFWNIYARMRYRPVEGGDFAAPQGIARAVGPGHLTVTGHSLGSALATYLALEVADPSLLGSRVEMVVFASPHPGDAAFGAAFNVRVPTHRAYWWNGDLVPKVPAGLGYAPLPGSIELSPAPSVHICQSITCAHHCLTYASMLDPSAIARFVPQEADRRFLGCLQIAS